jgi:hypothetical protein
VTAVSLSPALILAAHDLYARYNVAIDRGDAEAYTACFTPEGSLSRDGAVTQGSEALAAFARSVGERKMRHFVSNVVVDGSALRGRGSAVGRADVLVLQRSAGTLSVVASGTYADRLVLTASGWLFAERVYVSQA